MLFEMQCDATPADIRRVLHSIRTQLSERTLGGAETITIAELVLAEILNNISEHAYSNTDCGTINVMADDLVWAWQFHVLDQGMAIPEAVQLPTEAATPEASRLPESGFGLIIINTLADNLEYKRSNGTNHLSFIITKVPAPTPH